MPTTATKQPSLVDLAETARNRATACFIDASDALREGDEEAADRHRAKGRELQALSTMLGLAAGWCLADRESEEPFIAIGQRELERLES